MKFTFLEFKQPGKEDFTYLPTDCVKKIEIRGVYADKEWWIVTETNQEFEVSETIRVIKSENQI